MKKRYLVLADGDVFAGEAFGADADAIGELVFVTGMGGYLETLTNPAFFGQIVMHTFPLIGNYGVIPEDFEGECRLKGYVVGEVCDHPSNFRCQGTLDEFLRQQGIPGIAGVDTRELTRILRERGVMNALLCDEIPSSLDAVRAYAVKKAVKAVTHEGHLFYPAQNRHFTVALYDFGTEKSVIRELNRRGCDVISVPASEKAENVLSLPVDGVLMSSGPGDPNENTACIGEIRKLLGNIPMFGICLGHILMALSDGARTVKLPHGHYGENQPVRRADGGRTYVTAQGHVYAVLPDTLHSGVVSYLNANDGTCEGILYPGKMAFSVQFHPETAGPRDTLFLFDEFIAMMEEYRNAAR